MIYQQTNSYFDRNLLDRDAALARFMGVRRLTMGLTAPLDPEDMVIQSMPDVSPTKWHLGHTTWFFETFILGRIAPDYHPFDDSFGFIFNSYYEAEGPRHPRPERGMLSRPAFDRVVAYRNHVDRMMVTVIGAQDDESWAGIAPLLDLGCQHEEQHQELLLTDIKHVLSRNPLAPAYRDGWPYELSTAPDISWHEFDEGVTEIGFDGTGFGFDCEGPRHKIYQPGFRLASRAVTAGEYQQFVGDGGYQRPELWLSDGWATVQKEGWDRPLYWSRENENRQIYTLGGMCSLDPAEPVCHLSYFEADAFARWSGARLPTEAELEIAQRQAPKGTVVNDMSSGRYHPAAAQAESGVGQLFGDVWEWTSSAFASYPGFKPVAGAVGEYNGKFMCNQFVLKGGSCVTPPGHIRPSYRNFFYPHCRWQFTGLRLAADAG